MLYTVCYSSLLSFYDSDYYYYDYYSGNCKHLSSIHCVSKKWAPFLFLRLFCVLFPDLKNIWQYCSKGNLQQNTCLKLYIDA